MTLENARKRSAVERGCRIAKEPTSRWRCVGRRCERLSRFGSESLKLPLFQAEKGAPPMTRASTDKVAYQSSAGLKGWRCWFLGHKWWFYEEFPPVGAVQYVQFYCKHCGATQVRSYFY